MSLFYRNRPPPIGGSVDELMAYVDRELTHISNAFQQVLDVAKNYQSPLKLIDGMLRYADGVTWNPDAEHGEGFYGYWDGEWHYLACCDEGGGGGGCCYTTNASQTSELSTQDMD